MDRGLEEAYTSPYGTMCRSCLLPGANRLRNTKADAVEADKNEENKKNNISLLQGELIGLASNQATLGEIHQWKTFEQVISVANIQSLF